MIIFQTAGSGSGSIGLRSSLFQESGRCTTFRSNSYIHRLNRTLQTEFRAISAWTGVTGPSATEDLSQLADRAITGHQTAGRELVTLIIANRGIPEDRSIISPTISRALVRLCSALPPPLSDHACQRTLTLMEKKLLRQYNLLLQEAPAADRPVILNLKRSTELLAGNLTCPGQHDR